MNEILTLAPAWVAGLVIGAIFFGGLWWTVRKGLSSEQTALWFFGSLVLRMTVALGGFYFASGGRWERQLSCLVGFMMASFLVKRVTRASGDDSSQSGKETKHAPYSR